MYLQLENFCQTLVNDFDAIPEERKKILETISHYISSKILQHKPVQLNYICTHNSRRSHFGQVWASVAAHYYKVNHFNSFSGGTETTAFNPNAIAALKNIGFNINIVKEGANPVYEVRFDNQQKPVICFSKVYNDAVNPSNEFAAIMTCSDAEENCPFVQGAELRISTTYNDPKAFDNTPQQEEKYLERCRQIALETFYVFSKIKTKALIE